MRSGLVLSLLFAAATAVAQDSDDTPSAQRKPMQVVPGGYVFEFEDGQDTAEFYNLLSKNGGTTRMKLNYKLFNGVSVQLKDIKRAEKTSLTLARAPVVKNKWPIYMYDAPEQIDSLGSGTFSFPGRNGTKDTSSPHVMMQVDKLRADGITGKGVKLAVIDTGVDYKNPALGGCFGDGCLVSFGYDLVGDGYGSGSPPTPDADPMDCGGHGTHVSGIIAAQPNELGFTGVAPNVTLGMYKVFGCKGGTGTDILIAASNMAYEAGAQIITASVGAPGGWLNDGWTNVLNRIVDQGVICTVAQGNSGAQGAFFPSQTANGDKVFAIASYDNTITPAIQYLSSYSVDGGSQQDFRYATSTPGAWKKVQLPLWALNLDSTVADDGCQPFPDTTPDLSGKIVLIRRGSCAFVQKATNAAAKGAKYFLAYNNVSPGAFAIDVSAVTQIAASGMVSSDVGQGWIQGLKNGQNITLTMDSTDRAYAELPNPNGGMLSAFTSWGPTMASTMKPQFGGPGGSILSTLPRSQGGFGIASGTSMATPMVAGVLALIREARGSLTPENARNLLAANSNPQLFNSGTGFQGGLAPVPQQGAGLVQAYDAAHASTLLSPAGLSFNDSDHSIHSLSFTLSNKGNNVAYYTFSNVPAFTFYTLAKNSVYPSTYPNDILNAPAALDFSDNNISLLPGSSKRITIRPTAPANVDTKRLAVWSGYVAVNGSDGSSLSLPYQGLAGSLRSATTLTANGTFISRSDDTKNHPVPENTTFTLAAPGTGGNAVLPVLLVNLALGTSSLGIDVVSLNGPSPQVIGQLPGSPFGYLSRTLSGFYWNGQLASGDFAPAGRYSFRSQAVHIYGDASKAKDIDTNNSPAVIIQYQSA